MKATKDIRIWARIDAELYERIRRVAEARYEGKDSMVVRAALVAYLAREDQDESTEQAA